MSTKVCTKCKVEKPLQMFSKKLKGFQSKCKECCKIEHAAWHAANREKTIARLRKRYAENREDALEKQKAYYQNNRDDRLAYAAQWRQCNQDKIRAEYERNAEAYRERVKEWRAKNPEARRVQEIARRARLCWIPPWADRNAMVETYRQARELRALGVDCHVDHIVPLRGKTVSGLHTHNNLRIVLAEDNLKKNAKLIEGLLWA